MALDYAARATASGKSLGLTPIDIVEVEARKPGKAAEGEALLANRAVGVRLETSQAVEDLTYDLSRLPVIALVIPRFRDGRSFTAARLLRERYGFTGEIRAIGEVLREQAYHMVRCGFDAFMPSDGSDPATWAAAVSRFRHVYQRAADPRIPAYVERGSGA